MFSICKRFETAEMIWVFDGGRSAKRIAMMPEYKADRGKVDNLFASQVTWLEHAIKSLGGPCFRYPGVEADDIIAVIANDVADGIWDSSGEDDAVIVSSDKDFLQCITQRISVFNPIKNELTTEENIENWLGGEPVSRYLEVKSMIGDPSDSIPGIKGIGLKTAINSLKMFDNFESLPSSEFKGRMSVINEHESIVILQRNHALMSLPLAFTNVDVPSPDDLVAYIQSERKSTHLNLDDFTAWVQKSGMKSVNDKIDQWTEFYGESK